MGPDRGSFARAGGIFADEGEPFAAFLNAENGRCDLTRSRVPDAVQCFFSGAPQSRDPWSLSVTTMGPGLAGIAQGHRVGEAHGAAVAGLMGICVEGGGEVARCDLDLAPLYAGRGRERSERVGPGTAPTPSSAVAGGVSAAPESCNRIGRTASPLTRSPRCAQASTSPRKERGEVKKGASESTSVCPHTASKR
jgi:hypothetical protein